MTMRTIGNFKLNQSFDSGISIKIGSFEIIMSLNKWRGDGEYTLHRWVGSRLDALGVDSETNSNKNRVVRITGVDEL
jgi:hypothetical protein